MYVHLTVRTYRVGGVGHAPEFPFVLCCSSLEWDARVTWHAYRNHLVRMAIFSAARKSRTKHELRRSGRVPVQKDPFLPCHFLWITSALSANAVQQQLVHLINKWRFGQMSTTGFVYFSSLSAWLIVSLNASRRMTDLVLTRKRFYSTKN